MAKRPPAPDEVPTPDPASAPKDYEVGRGRPPIANRFKPGQSGNPKGRPKGAKNLSTLTLEKLQAKVPVREGGRERRMSKGEIGVTKLVNRFAETGDPKLYLALVKLSEGNAPAKETTATTVPEAAEEQASHAEILTWFLKQNRTDGGRE
ncbi:hypothetical protein ASG72_08285 [Bosea sp. Leaf344]|uniref:DUF5681 domain-containing protein n=1 Tax=Bosea sp. Leaf344 TaxID=1736346 RepID=UPI0007159D05|nr:DUF5681 domain-containing protein [Bosea sp. Leaf344]KQU51539.1 hypothetical protein ASG72_08285 [Bosea sp. Leaf344]